MDNELMILAYLYLEQNRKLDEAHINGDSLKVTMPMAWKLEELAVTLEGKFPEDIATLAEEYERS